MTTNIRAADASVLLSRGCREPSGGDRLLPVPLRTLGLGTTVARCRRPARRGAGSRGRPEPCLTRNRPAPWTRRCSRVAWAAIRALAWSSAWPRAARRKTCGSVGTSTTTTTSKSAEPWPSARSGISWTTIASWPPALRSAFLVDHSVPV